MSEAKAKEFIEKLYNDDDFVIEVCKNGGLEVNKEKQASKEGSLENFVIAGKALGYDFTEAEVTAAQKAYFDSLGAWKSLKKFVHFIRIAKKSGVGK